LAKENRLAAKPERKEKAVAERTEEADELIMRELQAGALPGSGMNFQRCRLQKKFEAWETSLVPNWEANKRLMGFQKRE